MTSSIKQEPQQNKNRDHDYQMKSLELKNTIIITQTSKGLKSTMERISKLKDITKEITLSKQHEKIN